MQLDSLIPVNNYLTVRQRRSDLPFHIYEVVESDEALSARGMSQGAVVMLIESPTLRSIQLRGEELLLVHAKDVVGVVTLAEAAK